LKHVNGRPMLYLFLLFLQALTYRVGHHSTSDDSTKYRPANEIEWWRLSRDPVARFRKWIERNGWWNDIAESDLRNSLRQQVNYLFPEKSFG
jgi:2-oxoisovalerate dehydrogenase E1 component alpha subunit